MENVGLIGYTGLVGSNILAQLKDKYKKMKLYNSKNISDISGEKFDLLIISGVSANKQFANMNPLEDRNNIIKLDNNLSKVTSKETILISTIDVFTEDAYGKNRLDFENSVKKSLNLGNVHVLRLPGIFGPGLKKNVIFDMKNLIPTFIKDYVFDGLVEKDPAIRDWYSYNEDKKIYEVKTKNEEVEKHFKDLGFTSLNFSNMNSDFYWFNLKYISEEILDLIENNIPEVTIISNVITNKEIAVNCGINLSLFKSPKVVHYKDVLVEGRINSYFKEELLNEIKEFINGTGN